MTNQEIRHRAVYPIQVVARRTGLSADVIRAWERRYNAVSPQRSATDRRLYSDHHINRLNLLRRATQQGRRIGDIATLSEGELSVLTGEETEQKENIGSSKIRSDSTSSAHLQACLQAVRTLDVQALDKALDEAALALSIPVLLDEVVVPLVQDIGEGWREGILRACHEHMATAQLRFFLGNLLKTGTMNDTGPPLLVATPAGQRHELGALMVALTAARGGWNPLYLGPDIPAREIAFAATAKGIQVVALSISYPADDPHLASSLRRLRHQLPASVVIMVGGAAARGYRQVLTEIGALQPGDLRALGAELDRIRLDSVRLGRTDSQVQG